MIWCLYLRLGVPQPVHMSLLLAPPIPLSTLPCLLRHLLACLLAHLLHHSFPRPSWKSMSLSLPRVSPVVCMCEARLHPHCFFHAATRTPQVEPACANVVVLTGLVRGRTQACAGACAHAPTRMHITVAVQVALLRMGHLFECTQANMGTHWCAQMVALECAEVCPRRQ